jgi:ParB family transcriptional regulator, chromosome partitioning protein
MSFAKAINKTSSTKRNLGSLSETAIGTSLDKIENEQYLYLSLDKLEENPFQPRLDMDRETLQELADSLQECGQIQPISVRAHPSKTGKFQIIAGHRRVAASKLADLKKIKAVITQVSEDTLMLSALIENLQRENLSIFEEAKAYLLMKEQFNFSQEEIAKKIAKSKTYVSRIMSLLKLPSWLMEKLEAKKVTLPFSILSELTPLEDNSFLKKLFDEILNKNLNRDQIRERIAKEKSRKLAPAQFKKKIGFVVDKKKNGVHLKIDFNRINDKEAAIAELEQLIEKIQSI